MSKRVYLVVLCVVFVPVLAWGDPFNYEPVDWWPDNWVLFDGTAVYNPWVTSKPYQRNIRYTFDDGQNMFLPIYQGYDDNKLKPSDYVESTPNIQWFADDVGFGAAGGAVRFGLVGIDNRQGTDNVTGWIKCHIDNWDSPNEWKHIWKEIIFTKTQPVLEEENVTLPAGYDLVAEQVLMAAKDLEDYNFLAVGYKVWPNPPWEEIYLLAYVPAGGYILIDEVHFATECVPEPASATLVFLAAGSLLALRRRLRRT